MHNTWARPNGTGCQTPAERKLKYAICRLVCPIAEARRFRDWNWQPMLGACQHTASANGYGQDMLDTLNELCQAGYQLHKPSSAAESQAAYRAAIKREFANFKG